MAYYNVRLGHFNLPFSFSKLNLSSKFKINLQHRRSMEQFIMDLKSLLRTKPNDCTVKRLNQQRFISMVKCVPKSLSTNLKDSDKVLKIAVEGNIGSGKTTFLSIFDRCAKTLFKNPMILPEPVDQWRNVKGVNIFQLLADDPIRWSFTFQLYVLFTMLQLHKMLPECGNVKLMERSLYSARYCFVENLHRKQLINSFEYDILDQWFNDCKNLAPIDLIIYLRTDPEIVFERIHRRARPEESKITLDYITSLHQLHEDWLIHENCPKPAPVISVDANRSLEEIITVYEERTVCILKQHQNYLQNVF